MPNILRGQEMDGFHWITDYLRRSTSADYRVALPTYVLVVQTVLSI